ncbi:MAG: hybrid sensor histidine kinase/response regulator [Anaerolineae bacterium]
MADVASVPEAPDASHQVGAMGGDVSLLEAVIEQMPSAVLIAEAPSGRVILANRQAQRLGICVPGANDAGGSPDRPLGQRADGRPYTAEDWPLARALRLGEAIHNEEITYARADGSRRVLRVSASPIRDSTRQVVAVVVVCEDITGQRYLQEELLRANKLESLAVLAGGIAHDFNNLLTAILGNVMLARMDVDPRSDTNEALGDAERASIRAKELTQQLLTFARGGPAERKATSLEPLLRHTPGLSLKGSEAVLRLDIAADLWRVHADENQIGQVIQNLVTNARESMPEGGSITVSAANEAVTLAAALPLPAGPYVRVSVSDTGVGIAADNLMRIYDPYFSTKGQRSGLGLAVCYSIVGQHDGCMTVESQPGVGSTFHVYLPAAVDEPLSAATTDRPPLPANGRVLVMDDEEVVRNVAERMLHRLGYQVEVAANGAEAIALYEAARRDGRPFDIVLMDLTVPGGMGGREAMSRLRQLDPGVVAVVSSGYATDPVLARFADYGFRGVVTKPYKFGELAEVLVRLSHRTE